MNAVELAQSIVEELGHNWQTGKAADSRIFEGLIVGAYSEDYSDFDSSQEVSYWGKKGFVVIFDGVEAKVYQTESAVHSNWYPSYDPRWKEGRDKFEQDLRETARRTLEFAALADEESAAQAQAWLEAKREQRAIEQANIEREREIERELQADKGRNVLVIKGDSAGTYGRCFWTGAKQVSYFSAILKLGIDAGGPRTEKGWAATPIWTAAGNAVAIPEDCLGIFDTDDVGNSGLAIAIAHVLDGLSPVTTYAVLQSLAASQVAVTLLRALGEDLRRAEAEWAACPKKGKGSTAAKRAAHGAVEAVSKRIFQVVENAKG
jgi:hypothetical protein